MTTDMFDNNKLVEVPINLLIFFGYHKPPGNSFFKNVIYVGRVLIFIGLFYSFLLMSETIHMYYHITDIKELPKALFLYLTHLIQLFKIINMIICKSRFQKLLDDIHRKEFQPKTLEQRERLIWYDKTSKFLLYMGLACCLMTCALWAIIPLTELDYKDKILPLPGWYPFSTTDSPNYELIYLYQVIAVQINAWSNACIDILITGLIMVVCSQLNMLNDCLQNIRKSAIAESDENFTGMEEVSGELQIIMDQKLEKCITHHKCILEFAHEITFLFSKIILGQFVVSVIIICTTLFEMTMVPLVSLKFVSLIFYQYCMLIEISMVCYFGNEVIVESDRLTTCAYHLDWCGCSKNFKRNLLIFMINSQKVLKFYAGGFFALSLDTFANILKSAWSFYAVLIQVNKETA